jgi:hypothetical protein
MRNKYRKRNRKTERDKGKVRERNMREGKQKKGGNQIIERLKNKKRRSKENSQSITITNSKSCSYLHCLLSVAYKCH